MSSIEWTLAGDYTEILYHKAEGIAKITINRPHVRNAFTPTTPTTRSVTHSAMRDSIPKSASLFSRARQGSLLLGGRSEDPRGFWV